MAGPQEQALRDALAGTRPRVVLRASTAWTDCADVLIDVNADLKGAAQDLDAQMGRRARQAAQAAFANAADHVAERRRTMRIGALALERAHRAIVGAGATLAELDGDPGPVPPNAPDYTGLDAAEKAEADKDYSTSRATYDSALASREKRAARALRDLENGLEEAADKMQRIVPEHRRNEEEPPSRPPVTPPTGNPPNGEPPITVGFPPPVWEPPVSQPPEPQPPEPQPPERQPPEPPEPLPPEPVPPRPPVTVAPPEYNPVPTDGPGGGGGTQGATPGVTGSAPGGAAGVSGGPVGHPAGASAGAGAGNLGGAAGGAVAGGAAAFGATARPSGMVVGAAGVPGRAIGSSSASAGRGTLSRGAAAGAGAGRGATGGRSGTVGRTGAPAGSRTAGRAGGRSGAAGAAGAAGGRGRDTGRRRPDEDVLEDEQDWLDDEEAAPGVID